MDWKKWGIRMGLLIASTTLFAGCGNSSGEAKEEEDTVTVWAWDETFNIKAVNEAKKVYENDDVTVDVVTMSQDDIVQKLNTALASGNTDGLPNIVLIEDYRIQGYLTSYPDAFAELNDIVDEDNFATYKFAVNKVDDKIYGVPFDSGVTANFYRTDLLEEAGYTEEDMNNLTWDDYVQVARDVKEKTGKKITEVNPSDLGRVRMIMQQAGEWYTSEDGKTVTIENNQSLKYGLELFATLLKEDLVEQTSDWNAGVTAIQSGSIASSPIGAWYSSTIQGAEDQSGKWKIAPIPALPTGMQKAQASNLGGAGWYVIKGVAGEEHAKDFLDKTFATNEELMGTLAKEIGLVSTMLSAKDQEAYQKPSEFYSDQKVFDDFSKWTAEIPEVNYGHETYAIESVVAESLSRIINGESADKVLADTQKQVEAQLAN
ncbi:extracellular solute-binding protein [Enterococcus sp. 10A9_DIV0425]|uniref:Extracellular solute-binding protein n=1 Tax=Candidatus Enterococcus wittei TaxID=1987383 RepID=A0A2C9XRV4_9ENTE|nr:extracellular solute-binding protein [Enterococcus sp. 10A9_DIV0425]